MIKYIEHNIKGVLLLLIGLMIIIITLIITKEFSKGENSTLVASIYESSRIKEDEEEVVEEIVLTEEQIVSNYLNENITTIEFFADMFDIDQNTLIELLKSNYQELDILNQSNFSYFLSEYLLNLENTNSSLFNKVQVPCKDSKEYMVALIKYFTQIYPEVDFAIAASIASIESNYTASTMLYYNNIFGGMSSGGLIRYRNIEYGILKYIKLLRDGYFTQGLTTVESIGYVYNPTLNENGVKIASPTWVSGVNRYLSEFQNYQEVSLDYVKSLKSA